MYEPAGIKDKGSVVTGVVWFENFITLVIISLRLYTRRFVKGQVGWDDFCLVITWLLMVVFGIFATVSSVHGMGQHFDDLGTVQFANGMMFILCAQFIVSLAIGMGKVVVAVFLLRIVTAPWQRWFLWFCIVSMLALSFLLSISVFAQCSPVQSIWDPRLADQKVCHISLTVVAFIDCAYAAFMDFALALFPWIALRGLNMKRKERITICLSLSLGVFAGACGIVRTTGLEALSKTSDYLYAISDSVVWTASEVSLTIICVSLPALRPLWKKVRGQESSSAGYQQHDDSAYNTSGSYHLHSYPGKPKSSCKNNFTDIEATRGQTAIKNDSDETILLQNKNKIHRVQEVTVAYESSGLDK